MFKMYEIIKEIKVVKYKQIIVLKHLEIIK